MEGAVCVPNFSASGRRRRTQVAIALSIGTVVAAIATLGAPWWARAAVGALAAGAAISGLQVRRNTCVVRAMEGTFEGEDFRRTKVDAAIAAESRRVALTIQRDGLLVGVAVGAALALL